MLSLALGSTNLDKFNEHKIIKIGPLEAEIFDILILGSRPIDLYRKKLFFHFSSYAATGSLRCIKCIDLHYETIILGGICNIYPQKPFFLGP